MKKFLTTIFVATSLQIFAAPETCIWYAQPAKEWTEAIPIGNGRLSGMVYGGITKDRIALNEISLWSGQPDSTSNDLCGPKKLAEMRQAFFENDPETGNKLGEAFLTGRMTSFGTHLPIGDLILDITGQSGDFHDYSRTLDLEKATVTVSYADGDTRYDREYIASFPDQAIILSLNSSKEKALDFKVGLDLLRKADVKAENDRLSFNGKVDFPMHGPGGVNFCGIIKVITDGGKVISDKNGLDVSGANSAMLIIDVRTDYVNDNYRDICYKNVEDASRFSWNIIKQRHISDYSNLFNRMEIDLGDSRNSHLPTDTRLHLAQNGALDSGLDALFFQYGRYMLIASSRPNGTPLCANLQGIWNDNGACNMPWTCDYHLDINIAQNYWSANRANLAECNEPLFNYIEFLSKNGADTARKMYGCDGWVAHTVCNAWGYTAPGWGISWGMNVTGGAWLATHLWSHYLYTRDEEYLRDTGYPLLKKTALFFKDYMTTDPRTGYLATGPSISPENGYVSPSGNQLSLSMMPTIDREIVFEIYNACIESSKILGTDKKFRKLLEKDIKRLPPIAIDKNGMIREWDNDQQRADPSHRHSSHLLGLFPLNQISANHTPELAKAARLSLESQTSSPDWEDTEWSTANMLCMYARLKDGNKAHSWLRNLFSKFTKENLMTVSPAGVAMAQFDIFSFDATEASVAGMCEMLLQSHDGFIEFLPALPDAWTSGHIKGLCAEGGLTIDMDWDNHKMRSASIIASHDCKINIKGIDKPIVLKKNEPISIYF